jgi:hypothetical protein
MKKWTGGTYDLMQQPVNWRGVVAAADTFFCSQGHEMNRFRETRR